MWKQLEELWQKGEIDSSSSSLERREEPTCRLRRPRQDLKFTLGVKNNDGSSRNTRQKFTQSDELQQRKTLARASPEEVNGGDGARRHKTTYGHVTSRSASRSYMKIVDKSYLGVSDEVTSLLESVEATFIKHFSNSNRREGMKSLRPEQKREKFLFYPILIFEASTSFFSGCSIAVLIVVVLLMESGKLIDKEQGTLYMENIFPLHSLYAYIVLHMRLYAANICLWRQYRINYPFIFGFKQGTELCYREVFLLSTGLAVLALPTFLAHLHLDSRTRDYRHILNCFLWA
ncbi:hypothetical protein HYC85_023380 [Camellia sinensis]|uniref:EXS domain-containing protein n=1 Tax=Camellia sinensis TaxID=4442 RepID=A0A7J7GGT1_CAMSI|nr:hypothetical protein HYC85_023380 [Camellia sinensis]